LFDALQGIDADDSEHLLGPVFGDAERNRSAPSNANQDGLFDAELIDHASTSWAKSMTFQLARFFSGFAVAAEIKRDDAVLAREVFRPDYAQ
jgi:hypothetical protein